jgi:hypothetical protein
MVPLEETTVRLTVGTVKNMITNCSWFKTGCLTSALANRASPRLRFSMNDPSAARWLPFTKYCQHSASAVEGYISTHLPLSLEAKVVFAEREIVFVDSPEARQSHYTDERPCYLF